MTDAETKPEKAGVRFPFINLEKALARAKELFDADPKGRSMTAPAAFGVWKYSEKSSGGFQTIAALKMYSLLKMLNGAESRKLALTDSALRYFRDEREDERQRLAQEFALKPKLIAVLWQEWGISPPADTIARSHLKADRGLNDQAARTFLTIYKENVAFTNLTGDAKVSGSNEVDDADEGESDVALSPTPAASAPPAKIKEQKFMQGERELTAGLLSKDAGFRLIVNGQIGVKEIERLIKKLEFDKEILAEIESDDE